MFDFPLMYNDANSSEFDESHTPGPHASHFFPLFYFLNPKIGQKQETLPTSD